MTADSELSRSRAIDVVQIKVPPGSHLATIVSTMLWIERNRVDVEKHEIHAHSHRELLELANTNNPGPRYTRLMCAGTCIHPLNEKPQETNDNDHIR